MGTYKGSIEKILRSEVIGTVTHGNIEINAENIVPIQQSKLISHWTTRVRLIIVQIITLKLSWTRKLKINTLLAAVGWRLELILLYECATHQDFSSVGRQWSDMLDFRFHHRARWVVRKMHFFFISNECKNRLIITWSSLLLCSISKQNRFELCVVEFLIKICWFFIECFSCKRSAWSPSILVSKHFFLGAVQGKKGWGQCKWGKILRGDFSRIHEIPGCLPPGYRVA